MKTNKNAKKTGLSVRQIFHALIIEGKLTDAQILARASKAAGKKLPARYVSWYRSELKRIVGDGIVPPRKTAKAEAK